MLRYRSCALLLGLGLRACAGKSFGRQGAEAEPSLPATSLQLIFTD